MHFLDLPENIFRYIFDFCDDDEIYFKFRAVCRQFKLHSDNYIRMDGKFILLECNLLLPKRTSSGDILLQGTGSAWSLYIFYKAFTKRPILSSFHWRLSNSFKIDQNEIKRYNAGRKCKCMINTLATEFRGIIIPGSCFSPQHYSNNPEINKRFFVYHNNPTQKAVKQLPCNSTEECSCDGIGTGPSSYNHSYWPHCIGRIVTNFSTGDSTLIFQEQVLRNLSEQNIINDGEETSYLRIERKITL